MSQNLPSGYQGTSDVGKSAHKPMTSTSQAKIEAAGARRSRRSRSSHRYETRIRRYKYLLAGLVILFMLAYLFTWFYVNRKSAESEQALLDMRLQQKSLDSIKRELDKVRAERDALVQGRIPGLMPLKYDEMITPDQPYIRNIIFTVVKNGQQEIYEYRLVVQNDTLSVTHPMFQILLFNDIGIQIGRARVQHKDASTATERPSLDPGEVRSYTAAIDLIRDEKPHYFLLVASEQRQVSADQMREQLGEAISP